MNKPTDKQLQVLQLYADGHKRPAVAKLLGLKEAGVSGRITNLHTMLGSCTIYEALAICIDKGYIIPGETDYKLPNRKKDIIMLLTLGFTRSTIAKKLWIEADTVGKHLQQLMNRTNSSSPYEAFAKVYRQVLDYATMKNIKSRSL